MARRSTARGPARSDRTESVCPLHDWRLFESSGQRARRSTARGPARAQFGERVSIARPAAVRALRPEGAPIARQTTFRGPARTQSGERVSIARSAAVRASSRQRARRSTARGPARAQSGERVSIARLAAVRALWPKGAPIARQTTFRGSARAVRRTRAVRRVRTVRSGAGSPRNLARRPREGIYLSHSVNSTSRTGAPASSGMKID